MKFKEAILFILKENLNDSNEYQKEISNGEITLSTYTSLNSDYSLGVGFYVNCGNYGYNLWLGSLNPFNSINDKLKEIKKDYLTEFLRKNYMFDEYDWEVIKK